MFRYILILVFCCLVVFAVTVFFRLGGHKPVIIHQGHYPAVALLYKQHLGPYHKINSTIEEVEAFANEHHLACTRTFGQYLDNPETHDEARLRSLCGCVLDGVQSFSLNEPLPEGMAVKELPDREYVIAVFEGAPSIGPLKVYPKVEDYFRDHRIKRDGAVIEIYTIFGDREAKTEYLFPIATATATE